MKQTNLSIFYSLGSALGEALGQDTRLDVGVSVSRNWASLQHPHDWLLRFLIETESVDIPETKAAAEQLNKFIYELIERGRNDLTYLLSNIDVEKLLNLADRFDACFEREYRSLHVFAVTQKGIYDTGLLLTKPEEKFSKRVRRHLPSQTLKDLQQAAWCLAFDIPTACAFHICRGTEALMLYYYEVLAGQPWPHPKNRDWKAYIDHLALQGAPAPITTRTRTEPSRSMTMSAVLRRLRTSS